VFNEASRVAPKTFGPKNLKSTVLYERFSNVIEVSKGVYEADHWCQLTLIQEDFDYALPELDEWAKLNGYLPGTRSVTPYTFPGIADGMPDGYSYATATYRATPVLGVDPFHG
jgi:hypothetical protein